MSENPMDKVHRDIDNFMLQQEIRNLNKTIQNSNSSGHSNTHEVEMGLVGTVISLVIWIGGTIFYWEQVGPMSIILWPIFAFIGILKLLLGLLF